MTPPGRSGRRLLAGPARLVRGVLVPWLPELEDRIHRLQAAVDTLQEEKDELRRENAEVREWIGQLAGEVDRLREGLHESRRLNLRVAELTDVVTELVLPLHDREIDSSVLSKLRPDTL